MTGRPLAFGVSLVAVLVAQSVAAQTTDWARVTVGLSGGLQIGSNLWDVSNQPILSSNVLRYPPDLYHLHRDIRSGFTLAAQVTHYSSRTFGLTAELTYFGLKLGDICIVTRDGGDSELVAACGAVGSSRSYAGAAVDQSASAMLFQGGIVLRPFRPATLQPVFKTMLGFATTPRSTIAMESTYGAVADTALHLTIYQDFGSSDTRPVITVSAGLQTAASSGLQVNFEMRETFLTQSIVTGPSASQNLVPPNRVIWKAIPSVLLGLELVLKRERGKRY
jgi:hypothetical protein